MNALGLGDFKLVHNGVFYGRARGKPHDCIRPKHKMRNGARFYRKHAPFMCDPYTTGIREFKWLFTAEKNSFIKTRGFNKT